MQWADFIAGGRQFLFALTFSGRQVLHFLEHLLRQFFKLEDGLGAFGFGRDAETAHVVGVTTHGRHLILGLDELQPIVCSSSSTRLLFNWYCPFQCECGWTTVPMLLPLPGLPWLVPIGRILHSTFNVPWTSSKPDKFWLSLLRSQFKGASLWNSSMLPVGTKHFKITAVILKLGNQWNLFCPWWKTQNLEHHGYQKKCLL